MSLLVPCQCQANRNEERPGSRWLLAWPGAAGPPGVTGKLNLLTCLLSPGIRIGLAMIRTFDSLAVIHYGSVSFILFHR